MTNVGLHVHTYYISIKDQQNAYLAHDDLLSSSSKSSIKARLSQNKSIHHSNIASNDNSLLCSIHVCVNRSNDVRFVE